MRTFRLLSLLFALAAVTGLVLGSSGFSAMAADRGVEIGVADDEDAYLGFEQVNDTVVSGESTVIVEYTNQFGTDLDEFRAGDVTVVGDAEMTTLTTTNGPDSVGAGEVARVAVTLHCAAPETVDLRFEANGSGGGVSVATNRVRTVTCLPSATIEAVRYDGLGNAKVNPDGPNTTVEAVVWLREKGSGDLVADRFTGDDRLDASTPVKPQLVGTDPANRDVAAIEFPNEGVAFFHPGWDAGDHANASGGDGVVVAVDDPLTADAVRNTSVVESSTGTDSGTDTAPTASS